MNALYERFDADDIFNALSEVATYKNSTRPITDDDLTSSVISYLTLYEGMSVVKLNGLKQKYEFEEAINKILPFENDKAENLFTLNF